MTEKRFTLVYGKYHDNLTNTDYDERFESWKICELLNILSEQNEQLRQDNNALIHLLKNQSIIIQELASKISEYQLEEPIILTKEDIEIMDKAISYYTHGRCGE